MSKPTNTNPAGWQQVDGVKLPSVESWAANTITVHLSETGWCATFGGPHAAEIVELFDTATLPLPFTAQAPLQMVLADIRARHPGVVVSHFGGEG